MTIKPVLQYRNADSTLDLNSTQAKIIDRAIFDGGSLTLSAVALQLTVAPFIATGFDGMIAISDSNEIRSVPAPGVAGPNRVSYLVLHLEYRTLTSPISNLQVIPESTWTSSVSKNYFITFASFSIPFGATSLTGPGVVVDYSVGDWADKLGKTGWRMPVANLAALPVVGNRDGDLRITLDTHTGHVWNSSLSSWSSFGGAIELAEVASRGAALRHQWNRVTSGSGFVNEILSGDGSFTPGDAVRNRPGQRLGFPFIPTSSVANTATIPGCHFLVNGHFIKTRARQLTFPSPPGVGERFDLLILEVWRQTVALPSAVTYDSVVPTAVSTFTSLRAALETLQEVGGSFGHSYDFSELEALTSTTFAATTYQFRVISNVSSSVLIDSSSVATSINNVDGNSFSVTGNDRRLWQAAAASSVDTVSWAIPLTVVRRSSLELSGPPYLDNYRVSGISLVNERFVFDVAPRAELGLGLFETQDNIKATTTADNLSTTLQAPSGFLTGATDALVLNSGSIEFPPSVLLVSGRELSIPTTWNVPLPSAPASGVRTDLLVLEVFKTRHSPPNRVGEGAPQLSSSKNTGTHQEQWIARPRVIQISSVQPTAEFARTASGIYTPAVGEPYVWNRSPTWIEGGESVVAFPLCLVHRRNTTAYALTPTGQNGANRSAFPGLPNQSAEHPYAGEVLDLRSRVVFSSEELQRTLDETLGQLITGELRTNMRTHPLASNVAGTQLLQVDQISAAAAPLGLYRIPAPPNGKTVVWSESDEAELVTWSFQNMDVDANDPSGVFTWNAVSNTLTITCPPGYHLSLDPRRRTNTFGPQNKIAYSTSAANPQPYSMVQFSFVSPFVPGGWEVVGDPTTPRLLKQTQNQLYLDAAALSLYAENLATVTLGVWMVRKNHEAGRSSALNTYANNRGLFAVPDLVHRIDYSIGAGPTIRAWVGPILNTIEVTIPNGSDEAYITAATLYASGTISSQIAASANALRMYAVTDISLSTVGWRTNLRTIDFDDGIKPGFVNCRLTFNPGSIPNGTTIRVTFLCSGDLVNRWFEVDPASKQVRGPYRVGFNQASMAASPPMYGPSSNFGLGSSESLVPYSDCGLKVIGSVGEGFIINMSGQGDGDLSFYAAGTGDRTWQAWFDPNLRATANNIAPTQTVRLQHAVINNTNNLRVGAYTAFTSAHYTGAGGAHSFLVLGCVRSPLPSDAVVRIFYEYTPYQGINGTLDSKINGTVEAISDDIVFTCGPNRPWLDPRFISTNVCSNDTPGFVRGDVSGADVGLFGSSGRISDRRNGITLGVGNSSYSGWFVSTARDRMFRPQDRPVYALSQRLPYPQKPLDGEFRANYVPESFLGNAALLQYSAVRPVPVASFYPRDEGSPWTLDYSSSPATRMWLSNGVNTTLYVPVPVNQGESVLGFTVEVESTGVTSSLSISINSRNRQTGFLLPMSSYSIPIDGPASTRFLAELSIPSTSVNNSGSSTQELVLLIFAPVAGLKIGTVFFSVTSSSSILGGGRTLLRFPYDEITPGIGRTLKKGTKLEVPSTWTAEFASFEATTTSSGREDIPGLSPARGRASLLNGDFNGVGGGLIGYVPGGDFFSYTIGSSLGPTLSYANRDVPSHFSTRAHAVVTGANAPDCAVGAASAYLVKNAVDATYMGVSTGYSLLGSSGSAFTRVGVAVDAYYPVGRPVFRRT